MKTYRVIVKEVLYHAFYVDAETEDGVVDAYNKMSIDGELDFSDGEVDVCEIVEIKEV